MKEISLVIRNKPILLLTETFPSVETKCSRFQYGIVLPNTVFSSFTFCDIPATFSPRSFYDVMFCHQHKPLADFLSGYRSLFCLYSRSITHPKWLLFCSAELAFQINTTSFAPLFSNLMRYELGAYENLLVLWYTLQ